ncbi:MAG: hypothetical protein KC493_11220 [Bacteriovoracaceae bacterium]|nr:hypothetical protein [Bacteriovoracaceae bacterium]
MYSLSILCLGLIRETGMLLAFIFFVFDCIHVFNNRKFLNVYTKVWAPFCLFIFFYLWYFFTGLSSFELNPVVTQRLTNVSVSFLEYLYPTGKGLYGSLVHYYGFLFYFIIISGLTYCFLPVPRFLNKYKNNSWIILLTVLLAIFMRSYIAINSSEALINYRTFNIIMASAGIYLIIPSFLFLHPIKNKNILVSSLLAIYILFLFAYGDFAPRDFLLPFVLLLIFPISQLFDNFRGTMFLILSFIFMLPLNFVPPVKGSNFNPSSLIEKRIKLKGLMHHFGNIQSILKNEKVYSNGPFCHFLNEPRYGLNLVPNTFECMNSHINSSIIIIANEYSFSERKVIKNLDEYVKRNNYSLLYTYKTGIETYKVYKK